MLRNESKFARRFSRKQELSFTCKAYFGMYLNDVGILIIISKIGRKISPVIRNEKVHEFPCPQAKHRLAT